VNDRVGVALRCVWLRVVAWCSDVAVGLGGQAASTLGHRTHGRPVCDSGPDTDGRQYWRRGPTLAAVSDGVVTAWQVFAKIVSVQHAVYLQARLI